VVRVAGVNIPDNKRLVIALTYIYGVGHTTSVSICKKLGVIEDIRPNSLDDSQIVKLREILDKEYVVESERKRLVMNNIKTKMDLGSYQGLRHRRGLPVRGQRTSTNARTRKGKAKTIANKKK
jgi:small subunit ribosomal protein S13